MRTFFFTLLTFFCTYAAIARTPEKPVTLTLRLDNCSAVDSFGLFRLDGLHFTLVARTVADANTKLVTFQVPATKTPQCFYVAVNVDLQHVKPVLLGTEAAVTLTGPCFDVSKTVATASPLNEGMEAALRRNIGLKTEFNKAQALYHNVNGSDSLMKVADKALAKVDAAKMAFLDSLKKKNPFLSKIIALDTYTSFQNTKNKAQYKDEIEYFAKEYFRYADFSDTTFGQLPQTAESFRAYAQIITMPELQLKSEQQKAYFDRYLAMFPPKKQGFKMALAGILNQLLARQGSMLLVDYGQRYIDAFPQDESNAQISAEINKLRSSMLGIPAPEITQADTAGNLLSLSSLKGKIVMIDFWASWCGPCRRENPNVVALYKKYQSKGFEIFSVSFDQDKSRWLQAIAADGLVWKSHVSDLRGWGNAAAPLYAVSSIPRTILLDRAGNILARDLRGEGLAAKLKELFGE